MDYTADSDVDERDRRLEHVKEIGRSPKWGKRRRSVRKSRRPAKPSTYMGQRSNRRLRRL